MAKDFPSIISNELRRMRFPESKPNRPLEGKLSNESAPTRILMARLHGQDFFCGQILGKASLLVGEISLGHREMMRLMMRARDKQPEEAKTTNVLRFLVIARRDRQ